MCDVPRRLLSEGAFRAAKYHSHRHAVRELFRTGLDLDQVTLDRSALLEIDDRRYERHADAGVAAVHDGVAVQPAARREPHGLHLPASTAAPAVLAHAEEHGSALAAARALQIRGAHLVDARIRCGGSWGFSGRQLLHECFSSSADA